MIALPARPEATFSVRSDGPFYQIHEGGSILQVVEALRKHVGQGIHGAMAAALAFMADRTRMSFVRAARKDTGMTARIEGAVAESDHASALHWGTSSELVPKGASIVTVQDGPLMPEGTRALAGIDIPPPPADDELTFDDAILTHYGDYLTTMGEPVNRFYDTIPGISRYETVVPLTRRFGSLDEGFDAVIAPAFGGIPLAVATAAVFDLPCLIVNLKSDRLEAALNPASFVPRNCLVVDDFISVGSRFFMLEKLFKRIGVGDATYAAVAGCSDSPNVGRHRLRLAFTLPDRDTVKSSAQ